MRQIVDLGTGSGANFRYLAPRLGGNQEWLLVDNDVTLLEAVEPALRAWAETLGLTPEAGSEMLTIRSAGLH